MSRGQRRVLVVATVVVGLMGLFPAWERNISRGASKRVEDLGYDFVFSPPAVPYGSQYNAGHPRIAVDRLVIQWVTVVLVAAGAMMAIGRKPETRQE